MSIKRLIKEEFFYIIFFWKIDLIYLQKRKIMKVDKACDNKVCIKSEECARYEAFKKGDKLLMNWVDRKGGTGKGKGKIK